MKIYFHLNIKGFSNCYIVVNEFLKEAIIIDPGQITEEMINRIEKDSYTLVAVFITHNHASHVNGLKTLRKIYVPEIYAADWEIAGNATHVITGDGSICIAGFTIKYAAIPGHTDDSMVYKIGNVLFTGDTISAGKIGPTNSNYSNIILRTHIERKIFSECDATVIMPGHGPPTSVGAEKLFNIGMTQQK
ncbi:MAG: MBL fold metallo-hydrolase [Treponema sp.]|nr:MBL fold metallo-hydrolase [Treponema sp.]